ncbi:hypothetical protein OIU78_028422 [Salix suchowensis]|nr:hypothetical protein OIU78_028422 [Salix suchowensis]
MLLPLPNFSVVTIESHNSVSAGDALRLIYERNVINGDFVLISGDTVSNMSLTQIPQTKQLLFYEEKTDSYRGIIPLDKALLGDNPPICLHNDKQDCYIDICSQEVLSLFTDNFDYQHLRRHFVKGLLFDDIMGYKIFTHEIHSSYAARIDNYQSYDTISKDIIQRWTYPFVLDVMFSGNSATHLEREGMYRASEIEQSRSAHIGSYIWDSVTIEDGCDIRHAIICDGVVIKSGAALEPGVVLSFKVVIGQQCIVPSYSKVSLYQQPTVEDSDKELEYVDNSSGIVDSSIICTVDTLNREMMSETPASQLGPGGVSHVWSICEGAREEEWRHSVAPIPADKLTEAIQSLEDDLELLNLYGNALSVSGELKSGRNGTDSEDDDVEDSRDDSIYYEREALEIPHATAGELRKSAASIIDAWNKLLKFYSKEIDPQIEVIMKFEEMCLESVKEFSPHFSQILHLLYDKDILEEDAILSKYGRFELNFMAKPSFTLDSMENDEDMERG